MLKRRLLLPVHRNTKVTPPPEHCASVKEYEKSLYWRKKSKALLDDHKCVCEICGRPRWKWQKYKKVWHRNLRFNVHHVTYENCPDESREDFMVLCSNCHTKCHEILRSRKVSMFYELLSQVVDNYFRYEGIKTFIPW